MEGLESNGILAIIRKFPEDAIKELTYHADSLTVDDICNLYASIKQSDNLHLKAKPNSPSHFINTSILL